MFTYFRSQYVYSAFDIFHIMLIFAKITRIVLQIVVAQKLEMFDDKTLSNTNTLTMISEAYYIHVAGACPGGGGKGHAPRDLKSKK